MLWPVDLSARIALVTGGSRGIGKAVALAMARSGACIVIAARSREVLDQVRAELEPVGTGESVVIS